MSAHIIFIWTNTLHNDPLEDFFRRSLDDFGDEPSDDVWSNLDERLALHESGLSAETITETSRSFVTNISSSVLWKWGGVAIIAGLLSLLSYHIYQQNNEIANLSEHIDQQTHTIEELNDKVENLKPSFDIATNKNESTAKDSPQNVDESALKNAVEAPNKTSTVNTNRLQKDMPNNIARNSSIEKELSKNSIEAAKSKTSIADTDKLQKDTPVSPIKPSTEGKEWKEKVATEGNSIEAAKSKTSIADTDKLQKDASSSPIKPSIEGKEWKKKVATKGNLIEAAKSNTNIADTDKLQKDASSSPIKPSIEGKEWKEKVATKGNSIEATKNNTNIADTDELVNTPIEKLEDDTPPLLTEEVVSKEKAAKGASSTASENAQVPKTKKTKSKQPKIKKERPTKTNFPKKKSSKPEGALAQNRPDSEAEKEVSVEVEEEQQAVPKTPSSSNQKWSIAASFAPNHSFRRIKNKNQKDAAKELNARETAAFSYDAGIAVGYKLSNKWSLKSGLQYRQVQQTSNLSLRLTCNQNNPGGGPNPGRRTFTCKAKEVKSSFGEIDIDFVLTDDSINDGDEVDLNIEHTQALNWLRIPLLVQYKSGKGKWKAGITGGLAANFLLNQTPKFRPIRPRDRRFQHRETRLQKPEPTTTQPPKISKSHLEYVVGLGVEYQANDQLHLFIEPTYSAALKPVFENKNIQTTPYSLSGNMGVRISF